MISSWGTLINLLENHDGSPEFTAECVYAYIVNYGMEHPEDSKLLTELVQFLERNEA